MAPRGSSAASTLDALLWPTAGSEACLALHPFINSGLGLFGLLGLFFVVVRSFSVWS